MPKKLTYSELQEKIERLMPGADIQTDNQGQFVIYTNLMVEDPDEIKPEKMVLVKFDPNAADDDDYHDDLDDEDDEEDDELDDDYND